MLIMVESPRPKSPRLARRIRQGLAWVLLPAFLALWGSTDHARAAIITHKFGGVITMAEGEFADLLDQRFTGTLTYDTDTPGSPATASLGTDFRHFPPYDPAVGLDIVIGTTEFFHDDNTEFLVHVSDGGSCGRRCDPRSRLQRGNL